MASPSLPSSNSLLLLLIFFILTLTTTTTSQQLPFRCTTTTTPTCTSLISYTPRNTTTLSSIQSLFNISNHRTILGYNNLPLSTSPNTSIPPSQTLILPFPCRCRNSIGLSNRRPIYTVVTGDTLFGIANDIFPNLVTFEQIQVANNISNPDRIEVGQQLWIPLPCSCDEVDGERVVHYGHVVEAGGSVAAIGARFNVSVEVILRVNNLTSAQAMAIQAGVVLDVPLRACTSMISNTSLDYPLLVPNNTYVFTARNCVRCRCDATLSSGLHCEPFQFNSSCHPAQCAGSDLFLGNTTSGCGPTCAYAGFNQTSIMTTVAPDATCPAPNGNGSSGIKLSHSSILLIAIHMMLLCISLLK